MKLAYSMCVFVCYCYSVFVSTFRRSLLVLASPWEFCLTYYIKYMKVSAESFLFLSRFLLPEINELLLYSAVFS